MDIHTVDVDPASDAFLATYEWRRLRLTVIKCRGRRCECCGADPSDGQTVINVDHIKPRKTHPELALDPDNLQVLCHACNHGKGNWDQTDWRAETPPRRRKKQKKVRRPSEWTERPGATFVVTRDWFEAFKTDRGAWTRAQIKALGVSWPPRKGWRSVITGKRITEGQRVLFEQGRHVFSVKTEQQWRKKTLARVRRQALMDEVRGWDDYVM